ncbi:response regulator transcription factor [Vibrio sinaloensis]|uniref:response regulator transcription factor n=1 Tax=Photobacterium sp. (strain ATCC 43367) TaxID=379097 RepID=UPI0022B072B6|nr:response regulator transcription factor [Vibrio sinaloensis]MCZ4293201.1 response regulator transcription factor [Vibrio sinaloensis]
MNSKILLIEDDKDISQLTKMYLTAEGYDVDVIDNGNIAVERIRQSNPDLVLLDLMLPGKTGAEICSEARQFYSGMIMVLTATEDDMSEVSLLKFGADDYVTKPVRGHILVARIEALLRRYKRQQTLEQVNHICDAHGIVINNQNQTAYYDHKPICLTNSEFEILQLLIEHAGQTVSREHCCRLARGIEYDVNNRSIDMRISGLRKKLIQAEVYTATIKTVRNQGYRLVGTSQC